MDKLGTNQITQMIQHPYYLQNLSEIKKINFYFLEKTCSENFLAKQETIFLWNPKEVEESKFLNTLWSKDSKQQV